MRKYNRRMNGWAVMTHLRRIHHDLHDRLAPGLRARGLSNSALFLLSTVAKHPFATDVSRALGLPAPSVSRLLKGLQSEGYLMREPVPEDLRRYHFQLTPSGRQVLAAARAGVESAMDAMLERLSPAERRELERLLQKLAGAGPAVEDVEFAAALAANRPDAGGSEATTTAGEGGGDDV